MEIALKFLKFHLKLFERGKKNRFIFNLIIIKGGRKKKKI